MGNFKYNIRRIHRYMGLFIGIQFFLWTIGGLYFSWSNLDKIHGDHLVNRAKPFWNADIQLIGLDNASNLMEQKLDSIYVVRLVDVLDEPCYQIHGLKDGKSKVVLVNAKSGEIRPPLNREEAIQIAENTIAFNAEIKTVELITSTNGHHEYREKPLPVWAITYDYDETPTLYISSDLGQFISIRQNNWRLFDWLWMLHTMDYSSRDFFGNVLLKGFSILGLITVLSGFTVFYTSSPTIRKLKKKFKKKKT